MASKVAARHLRHDAHLCVRRSIVRHLFDSRSYSRAYAAGDNQWKTHHAGGCSGRVMVPREEWVVLTRAAHPGYLTREEHECTQRRLRGPANASRADRCHFPPWGCACPCAGRANCGTCGWRMSARQCRCGSTLVPDCQRPIRILQTGSSACQGILEACIDAVTGELLVGSTIPMAVGIALAVWQEAQGRRGDVARLRFKQVERDYYDADPGCRCHILVGPSSRLVPDSQHLGRGAAAPLHEGVVRHLPESLRRDRTSPCDDGTRVGTAASLSGDRGGGDAHRRSSRQLEPKGGAT